MKNRLPTKRKHLAKHIFDKHISTINKLQNSTISQKKNRTAARKKTTKYLNRYLIKNVKTGCN